MPDRGHEPAPGNEPAATLASSAGVAWTKLNFTSNYLRAPDPDFSSPPRQVSKTGLDTELLLLLDQALLLSVEKNWIRAFLKSIDL